MEYKIIDVVETYYNINQVADYVCEIHFTVVTDRNVDIPNTDLTLTCSLGVFLTDNPTSNTNTRLQTLHTKTANTGRMSVKILRNAPGNGVLSIAIKDTNKVIDTVAYEFHDLPSGVVIRH